jgi:hypothetical protein
MVASLARSALADRGRYATDASIHQVMPAGVIVPRGIDDVAASFAICRAAGGGYQAGTTAVLRAMAGLSLLPAIRAAGPDDLIVAAGMSCRHQIGDLGGRAAAHSVRVFDLAMGA